MVSKKPQPIHLEGTTLEGGGQLLRIALGLSSLTKKPVHITNIRGKRSGGGGLKAQHLTSMLWLGQASNARISGAGLKSKEITFTPHALPSIHPDLAAGHVTITQSTPGSINLVLQAVLPYILFSGAQNPIQLRITGGTNVSASPSLDYVEQVLIPMLSLIGIPHITLTRHSRGWSTGTTRLGSATFTIHPLTHPLPAFRLTSRGPITHLHATIIAPLDTEPAFRTTLDQVITTRSPHLFAHAPDPHIDITFEPSHHAKRYYLLVVATSSTGHVLGRDWLYDGGKGGKTIQIISQIVRKVVDDLVREVAHGGCVDEWMRDQLVVYQALAQGTSRVDGGNGEGASLHARTAMWVAGRMVGARFDEEGSCEGVELPPGGMSGDEFELSEGMRGLGIGA